MDLHAVYHYEIDREVIFHGGERIFPVTRDRQTPGRRLGIIKDFLRLPARETVEHERVPPLLTAGDDPIHALLSDVYMFSGINLVENL